MMKKLYAISKDSNRMGFQLNETIVNNLPSILTSAVMLGTVQLTPSSNLIILMKNSQFAGGYLRVL